MCGAVCVCDSDRDGRDANLNPSKAEVSMGHQRGERDRIEGSDPEFRLEIEICNLLCYKSVTY